MTLVDRDDGLLYMVFFKDNLTAARMVLPRFVAALAALLRCGTGEVLVVPYTECTLFVGVCRYASLSLVAGRWSLVAGRWSLVAGRWSLVTGHSS